MILMLVKLISLFNSSISTFLGGPRYRGRGREPGTRQQRDAVFNN